MRQCNSMQPFSTGQAIQLWQPQLPVVPNNPRDIQYVSFVHKNPVATDFAGMIPEMGQRNLPQTFQSQNINGHQMDTSRLVLPQHFLLVNPLRQEHVCKWQTIDGSDGQLKTCARTFATIFEIVEHISEEHVTFETEGDGRFCYWEKCERKMQPFKARYKLINHIRLVNLQIICKFYFSLQSP